MTDLIPRKGNNVGYVDLIVLPDDEDENMAGSNEGGSEVTPPPIRYYFNS
jgi:hypothetical protein